MKQVHERIFVGDERDSCLAKLAAGLIVVHACKDPCHRRACGNYKGSLPNTHPNYLWKAMGASLYLNMIDPPTPLFKIESFQKFFDWTVPRWKDGKVIFIHCNKGESRSPTLAMLLMVKLNLLDIPETDEHATMFDSARAAFERLYPDYRPGAGIETFLREHWNSLLR